MGQRQKAFAAGLAVAALTLSACGSGSGDGAKVADKPTFEAGTTMAKISAAGKMKVGNKCDQHVFGLKGRDRRLDGCGVQGATIKARARRGPAGGGVRARAPPAPDVPWVPCRAPAAAHVLAQPPITAPTATSPFQPRSTSSRSIWSPSRDGSRPEPARPWSC